MEEKKLHDAAVLIQTHCQKWLDDHRGYCCGCFFMHKDGSLDDCMFCDCGTERTPNCWSIPKAQRFTDADKKLAEALKMFGCSAIERLGPTPFCRAIIVLDTGHQDVASLPSSAFKGIKNNERVSISEIIEEGK